MFDIGFTELVLIAIIALVVIGPKRLPETLRFVGLWVGRIKRALARAYKEIDQELGLDDVRRQLHNEEVLRSIDEHKRKLEEDIRNTMDFTTDTDPTPTAPQSPDDAPPRTTPATDSADDKAAAPKGDRADG